MSDNTPAFTGTPHDWWEAAERITVAEATERTLGNWYITKIRTAGDTNPNYRLSTPSRPANMDKLAKLSNFPAEAERVRLLIRNATPEPAWRTATYVEADLEEGSTRRVLWIRKRSGRWHCLEDGRKNINDDRMAKLNPLPATFTTLL